MSLVVYVPQTKTPLIALTASSPVQNYLKAVPEEQFCAHIVPKQAVPFFLPKLLLARLWDRKMTDLSFSPSTLFILA